MGPNIGGGVDLGWVSVKLTPAWHTSTTPNGTVKPPAGLLLAALNPSLQRLGERRTRLDRDAWEPQRVEWIGGHAASSR
jgi:hypothetical protein